MNNILESAEYIVDNSISVKIIKENIELFCKKFKHEHIKHWLSSTPIEFSKMNDKEKLNFLFLLNSISFSYWENPKWKLIYKDKEFDGAFGMIAALGKAIEERKLEIDFNNLKNIKLEDLKIILHGSNEIPLIKERLNIIKEISGVITERYNGNIINLIKEADGDAISLLNIITENFKSFNDVSMYNNKKVYFYKRAQLLVSDIFQMFKGKSYGNLKNTDKLTACADYKLPQVLRKYGILVYSKELSQKIDNKIEIKKDSKEEIEIRANTILAVELIKNKLKRRISHITSMEINDHLWLLSQDKIEFNQPYHHTRTTNY